MMSIAVFGVNCELEDSNNEYSSVIIDHFRMTRQEVEAAGLLSIQQEFAALDTQAEQTHRERWVYASSLDQLHWPVRWLHKYRMRRKKRTTIKLTEFADLSDSRRVIIRSDRGFSWSWKHSPSAFHRKTQESFTDNIRNTFAQYEENCPTQPEWIAERLQRLYGIEVNPVSVYAAMRAPLRVEFGPRLLEQLPR